MRPAYADRIPSRKTSSTKLLDATYEKYLSESRNSLNSDSVLVIDGWKNSSTNSKTVVSMIHNANGNKCFVNAWDLSTESETGEKWAEIALESASMSKDLYNTNIYATVSDNAACMVKMGNLTKHKFWHIIAAATLSTYWLNI